MTRTDSERSEEAPQRFENQVAQAQKVEAIERLAGTLAHDLNNLLTAISGYSGLILKRATDERLRTYVGEIKKAGDRATDLTAKLLKLSRQQTPSRPSVAEGADTDPASSRAVD